jgi:hypothetical protein
MLDLYDEFRHLIEQLDKEGLEYAVCGGLALAVHGQSRATIDIDLLIQEESLDNIIQLAKGSGYNIRGKDLSFARGAIEIRRVSKIDPDSGDILSLDLLLITPEIEPMWNDRLDVDWAGVNLTVVSRDALIALKRMRSSEQDLADIAALRSGEPDRES